MFTALNRTEAQRLLQLGIAAYEKTAPKLAQWMEANVPEGLTSFDLPIKHLKPCRTVNAMEPLSKEIARRTRVAALFPSEE